MTVILIKCKNATLAQSLLAEVNAGDVWGVNMGTTSRGAAHSSHCLIECTNTRNLALIDGCPEGDDYDIEYSINEPDSFSSGGAIERSWFLRGML